MQVDSIWQQELLTENRVSTLYCQKVKGESGTNKSSEFCHATSEE